MGSELKKGERRDVWVKAVWYSDPEGEPHNPHTYGVEKILLVAPDGEELWDWLIFADDVAHIPRDSGHPDSIDGEERG